MYVTVVRTQGIAVCLQFDTTTQPPYKISRLPQVKLEKFKHKINSPLSDCFVDAGKKTLAAEWYLQSGLCMEKKTAQMGATTSSNL